MLKNKRFIRIGRAYSPVVPALTYGKDDNMPQKDIVSVIIPTYNRAHIIGRTVGSVLNQTYGNFEIIVIDDGSTDQTRDAVMRFNDRRIRYVQQEYAGLPAICRNRGLRLAGGEYVAFLDSDDLWLPQKLSRQIEFMRNNPQAFLVYSRCFVQEDGKVVAVEPRRPKSGYVFEDLYLAYNFIPCLTVMMRNPGSHKDYFFDEHPQLKAAEDYDLWLTIAMGERIGYIDEPLAIYVKHRGSISAEKLATLKKWKFIMDKFAPSVSKQALIKKRTSLYAKYIFFNTIGRFI